jgi:hypothetical protein
MVKITELSNEQLLGQVTKYNGILQKLFLERDKRLKKGAPENELFTKEELAERVTEADEPAPEKESGDVFQFTLDDIEIQPMSKSSSGGNSAPADEEMVRVTQLLKLSKDELKELQDAKEASGQKKGSIKSRMKK